MNNDIMNAPEYSVAIDGEGRAWQLVKDYLLDELRWTSWVESPEDFGYTPEDFVRVASPMLVYTPHLATVTSLRSVTE